MSKTFDEKYVKQLRNESAGYRTKVRELEKEYTRRKAEVEKMRAEVEQIELDNLKDEIVKDSHVPASVLRGETESELRQHHNELAPLFKPPRRTFITADTEVVYWPDPRSNLENAIRKELHIGER